MKKIQSKISRCFIHKQVLLLLLTSIMVSCESFLEERPTTSLDKKTIFSSEASARAALLGCYNQYANNLYRGELYELNSSIILSSRMTTNVNTVAAGVLDEITPNTPRIVPNFYLQAFTAIEHINVFLESIQDSPVSDTFKQQHAAEARFLRGVIYFDLVRLFGRVPLKTSATTLENNGNLPRASMKDIYSQIITDFEDAAKNMRNKDEQEKGFPHNLAATSYLAKVYVQMACLTDEHLEATNDKGKIGATGYAGSAVELLIEFIPEVVRGTYAAEPRKYFWEQAIAKAETVINKQAYDLKQPFSSLWRGRTRNTDESIFEIQYSAPFGSGTNISGRTSPDNRTEYNPLMLENTAPGRTTVNYSTFSRHWEKYGSDAKRASVKNISRNNEPNADPRFNESYVYFSYNAFTRGTSGAYDQPVVRTCFPQSGFLPHQRQAAFPFIKKHLDSLQTVSSYSNVNFIVYRYADLLLLYAESLNELNRTNEAITVVNNNILDRARRSGVFSAGQTPQPANWSTAMTQDQVRDAIMEEREYELLGEGHETFDVRRRGAAYLKKRIDIHDDWYEFMRADSHWSYTKSQYTYFKAENYIFHRVYREYGPFSSDPLTFCKKHLFIPFPQKEINLNTEITAGDQNFGW